MLSQGQVRRNSSAPPPSPLQTSTIYHELQVHVLSKLQSHRRTQVSLLLASQSLNPRDYTGSFSKYLFHLTLHTHTHTHTHTYAVVSMSQRNTIHDVISRAEHLSNKLRCVIQHIKQESIDNSTRQFKTWIHYVLRGRMFTVTVNFLSNGTICCLLFLVYEGDIQL